MSGRGWIAQQLVDEVVATVAATRPAADAPTPEYGALHGAASVLTWFTPDVLRPMTGYPADSVDLLLHHSEPTADADGNRRWALDRDVRVAVLHRLREHEMIEVALAVNPERPPDQLQIVFEQHLTGTPSPLQDQSLEMLACTKVVCDWLRAADFPAVPTADAIDAQLEWMKLLQPFDHLVGTTFCGRTAELDLLRRFLLPLVPRLVASNYGFPPVLIYGPGGVGKSTLLARALLEHAQAPDQGRRPIVYLDFDRPDVDAAEPLTLLMEAVRQLGAEYPHARKQCDVVRRQWQQQVAQGRRDPESIRRGAVQDFATVARAFIPEDQTLLFVLDTFEEVQWRSQEQVNTILRYLAQLHGLVPQLRVCISGRADVYGYPMLPIELTGLDEAAAREFLRVHGVDDPAVSARLVEQVGRSPLSLKLAAQVYRQNDADLDDLPWRLHLNVSGTLLQRQLYQRILRRIHDPQVRKLAHPGLVLRRITPELIQRVLAVPCGISAAEPAALFEELRREVSLVHVAADGSLHHRSDVRRLMVDLLRDEQPGKVRAIDLLAVEYYSSRPSRPVDRAEEIYHRLALDQDPAEVDGRWMPGVGPLLASAINEFPGARRAYLASRLGVEVDAETRRLASLDDWERLTYGKAQHLLQDAEQTGAHAAIQLINERSERSAVSPLTALEVAANRRLDRWERCLALLAEAVDRAAAVDSWPHVLRLSLLQAETMIVSQYDDGLPEVLHQLESFAVGATRSTGELHAATRHVGLRQLMPAVPVGGLDARIDELVADLCDGLSDHDLAQDRDLVRWVCAITGPEGADRLARLLPMAGLADDDLRGLRTMAATLAQFDSDVSAASGAPAGLLAERYGIIRNTSSLTSAWSREILSAGPQWMVLVLGELLRTESRSRLSDVIAALNDMMLAALNVMPGRSVAAEPLTAVPAVHLAGEGRQRLAEALATLPPAWDLREFVQHRLNRAVDSMTGSRRPAQIASDLVETADREGWLGDLVVAATQAFPHVPAFGHLAARMKLVVPTSGVRSRTGEILQRAELAVASSRVCVVKLDQVVIATGTLVGVDLVLVAASAVGALLDDPRARAKARVSFDGAVDVSGRILDHGSRFVLAPDWRAVTGEHYCLLRLREAPGAQPVGAERSGATGVARGWVDLTRPLTMRPGTPVLIVGSAAFTETSLVRVLDAGSGGRLLHNATVGAPCFNYRLDLVGMLIGPNRVLFASTIAADLRERGLSGLLRASLA